ncbi:M23 family metallopeptidase [Agromyces seonyuensis]|uniref:Peptidoglycan DD-metalloendopeptidase family protein n=1 Tax=Agromyces seonyuensis TaxID=2662446 RepID=A0A6I4P738_9MICO|nr:M23 family metallopeptidase [Agromyces seonyuensis]MWB99554.1 peptidoglycan DD-metalloendopeptidase family protein [Agromyces seonyuensis]
MIEIPQGPNAPQHELPPARESAPGARRTPLAYAARFRRLGVKLSTVAAMALVGGLTLTTAVPANAVAAVQPDHVSVYASTEVGVVQELQSVVVADDVTVPTTETAEGYAVVSGTQIRKEKAAAAAAAAKAAAAKAAAAEAARPKLVWPTKTTAISDGFGYRSMGFHDGVDFVPGNGTPVMALADGVVTAATEDGGTWGVMITIRHVIEGKTVYSLYGHMQHGSMKVAVGQQVKAGAQIGVVGSTGWSTGPHMHLEMYGEDGVRWDGLAWLHARLG